MLSAIARSKSLAVRCLIAAMLLAGVGCDSAHVPVANQNQSATSSVGYAADATANHSPVSIQQSLVGTWLGHTVIDEQMLEQQLTKMTLAQQEEAVLQAEGLLSTVMAIQYRGDGTMESAIEVTPLGEPTIKAMSVGQWRVADFQQDRVMVESQESDSEGVTSVNKNVYRIYPDRNAFAMTVPTSPLLSGCDVLMIFERQATLPAANMAETPRSNLQK